MGDASPSDLMKTPSSDLRASLFSGSDVGEGSVGVDSEPTPPPIHASNSPSSPSFTPNNASSAVEMVKDNGISGAGDEDIEDNGRERSDSENIEIDGEYSTLEKRMFGLNLDDDPSGGHRTVSPTLAEVDPIDARGMGNGSPDTRSPLMLERSSVSEEDVDVEVEPVAEESAEENASMEVVPALDARVPTDEDQEVIEGTLEADAVSEQNGHDEQELSASAIEDAAIEASPFHARGVLEVGMAVASPFSASSDDVDGVVASPVDPGAEGIGAAEPEIMLPFPPGDDKDTALGAVSPPSAIRSAVIPEIVGGRGQEHGDGDEVANGGDDDGDDDEGARLSASGCGSQPVGHLRDVAGGDVAAGGGEEHDENDCERSALLDEMLLDAVSGRKNSDDSSEPTSAAVPRRKQQEHQQQPKTTVVLSAVEKQAMALAAACVAEEEGKNMTPEQTSVSPLHLKQRAPVVTGTSALRNNPEVAAASKDTCVIGQKKRADFKNTGGSATSRRRISVGPPSPYRGVRPWGSKITQASSVADTVTASSTAAKMGQAVGGFASNPDSNPDSNPASNPKVKDKLTNGSRASISTVAAPAGGSRRGSSISNGATRRRDSAMNRKPAVSVAAKGGPVVARRQTMAAGARPPGPGTQPPAMAKPLSKTSVAGGDAKPLAAPAPAIASPARSLSRSRERRDRSASRERGSFGFGRGRTSVGGGGGSSGRVVAVVVVW